MKLKWNNIILAILATTVLFVALRHSSSCRAALETVGTLAPHEPVDDRFVGFMVLGLVMVALVAIVKVATRNRQQDRPERRDQPPQNP